ncbi:mismatch-specific DNA-glycosylase [Deinococcus detaillensis]|uniref:Mismatch-specific DNA-glycosylase n=1 Tax=Deinococcus detaillensis TaxID=2592048 RepID=A0A553V108_9DEIO|nr:mismatch-specific DNA-glycosylase [Deinococcus detaillensis]TSA86158.1 mismatch-specific DNA-glycosylase [Deinococcus detaillensis]
MSATATTEPEHGPEPSGAGHLVPDLLAHGLKLVLIGTAPSRISAAAGAYYANPQNKFWRVLFEVGLTPHLFKPQEFPALLALGIGLTDVAKKHSGVDASLPSEAWEPTELRARIAYYRPEVVAFTSKRGASQVLGLPTGKLPYGPRAERLEGAEVWVLPSTSPLGHTYFQLEPWQALAEQLKKDAGSGNSPQVGGVL